MPSAPDFSSRFPLLSTETSHPTVLNRVLEESADSIKVLDLEARVLSMNQGTQQALEIDDFSVYQRRLWPDFWTGQDRIRVEAALDRARLGESSTFEGQRPTFKGTLKWWEVRVAPVRDENGTVGRLLTISRDITARKQEELTWGVVRAKLERQVQAQHREVLQNSQAHQAFMAFTEAVGLQTDVTVLAREAVHVLQRQFKDASIGYYQRNQHLWTALAWSDDLSPEAVAVITAGVSSEHPVIAEVLAAQEAVFEYTYLKAAVGFPLTYQAVGSVPMTLGGEVCGLLSVGFRTTPVWGEQDRQLLRAVARGLNLALERAAQTRQLELERASLSAFTAFTELVGTETDVEVLFRQAARLLQQTRAVDVAYVERDGEAFRVRHATSGFPLEVLDHGRPRYTLNQVSFDPARSGEEAALFVDDWNAEHQSASAVRAAAYLPFFQSGRVSGMLTMTSRDQARWTVRDQGVFRAVGRSLALALERGHQAELLQEQNAELQAQTRALEGIAQLSHDLALEADPLTLIRRALELVLSLLPDGFGAFCTRTDPVWQVAVRVGDGRNEALRARSYLGFPVGQTPSFDRPFETRKPFFQDVYNQSLDLPAELVAQVHTTATLPLIVNGEVFGIFAVSLFETHRWNAADRALLGTAVRSLGLVIEGTLNVARLAEERRLLALTTAELESFVYSASHDLLTPVRHVMSFTDLARKALVTTPNEKAGRHLEIVQQAAVKMTDLLNAMLVLSRAGRQGIVLRPVDLNAVVAQVRQELTTAVPDRQVDWQVGPLPVVTSDLDLLQNVLVQLLGNALKFSSGREETRLHVWAEERGAVWTIFVRDNGLGFDPKYQHKLFGVFQRLHSEKQFGGVGIGLALVRRIVLKLGGEVFAEGQVEQGATFGFTLPKKS